MKIKKESTLEEKIKKRLPYAALAGFCSSFIFLFFGVLDIFAQNRDELLFAFSDFGLPLVLFALGIAVIVCELIVFLPGRLSDVLFGIVVWVTVMGYIQAVFLNGSGGLAGDSGEKAGGAFTVIDTVLWIITGALCIWGALKMKDKNIFKTIFAILLIAVFAMQLAGCLSEIKDIAKDPLDSAATSEIHKPASEPRSDQQTAEPTSSDDSGEKTDEATDIPVVSAAYLTTKGLCEVSSGKNIIIFLIDRFDVSYYQDVINETPEFFDKLDGFTYFNDNISLYSRTYPGVTSMITGIENDFSDSKSNYFLYAYKSSPFLKDLKSNNYKIKLYTSKYYSYQDGTPLYGIADNLSIATDYTITDRGALVGNMIALSAYRYLPTVMKSTVDISTSSFAGLVDYNGDDPFFEINDPEVYKAVRENGLSLDDSENSYIFIHLSGCHDPYIMDEDGSTTENGTVRKQLRGCFNMIYEYVDELKRLGVYDDSTIIITGDHPRARNDAIIPEQPRITALFVKPTKSTGKLAYSSAQVSQENLIPTLVSSAGISTSNDYGKSYFDISADEVVSRRHNFELYVKGESDRLVTFEVSGKGEDFENWKITSNIEVNLN